MVCRVRSLVRTTSRATRPSGPAAGRAAGAKARKPESKTRQSRCITADTFEQPSGSATRIDPSRSRPRQKPVAARRTVGGGGVGEVLLLPLLLLLLLLPLLLPLLMLLPCCLLLPPFQPPAPSVDPSVDPSVFTRGAAAAGPMVKSHLLR